MGALREPIHRRSPFARVLDRLNTIGMSGALCIAIVICSASAHGARAEQSGTEQATIKNLQDLKNQLAAATKEEFESEPGPNLIENKPRIAFFGDSTAVGLAGGVGEALLQVYRKEAGRTENREGP